MPTPLFVTDPTHQNEPLEAGALVRLLNSVLRHSRILLVCMGLGFVAPTVFELLQSRTFTSSGAFIPQASNSARSQLSGLAAQFGLNVDAMTGSEQPGYYPQLIQAPSILRLALDTVVTLPYHNRVQTGPLWAWLDPKGKDEPQKIESAVDKLTKHIKVSRDQESGIINYSVTYPDSLLPSLLARRLLRVVNDFNLYTKQTQASAERVFVEGRLADAKSQLAAAEQALQSFLQNNREYHNSPQLVFEQDRLQREMTMRQSVVTTLTQSYEQARIDEVRNTPLITVLAQPRVPVVPDPRGILLKAAIGIVLGALLGAAIAVLSEFMSRVRASDPVAYAELSRHLRSVPRLGRHA